MLIETLSIASWITFRGVSLYDVECPVLEAILHSPVDKLILSVRIEKACSVTSIQWRDNIIGYPRRLKCHCWTRDRQLITPLSSSRTGQILLHDC